MSEDENELKIQTDVERDVLNYVKRKAKKSNNPFDLILTNISESIRIDEEDVETALDKLESEKKIFTKDFNYKIYLPNNKDGQRFVKIYRELNVIPRFSLLIKMILGIILVSYLSLNYYTYDFATANITTLLGAFRQGAIIGVSLGTFLAFLIGSVAAKALEIFLDKIEVYKAEFRALSVLFVIIVLMGYVIFFKIENDATTKFLLFLIGTIISIAAVVFTMRKRA
ncbi:MAG: DUF1493 family protein [Candidatus Aenigmarchaeota archaeon]|nr:DUF1493 family protein [Candidatus Aenigmarchaeota archaeon]